MTDKKEGRENIHEIYLRDPGTRNPKDSEDYDWATGRISSLIKSTIKNSRRSILEQFDRRFEEVETREEKRRLIYAENRYRSDMPDKPKSDDIEELGELLNEELKAVFKDKLGHSYKESHLHIKTPFSWFEEIRRQYRGSDRSYVDAILILSYICFCYRYPTIKASPLLHIRPNELKNTLDISQDCKNRAFRYLRSEGLIKVLVIKGLVPWYKEEDRKSGSYKFVLPSPGNIRDITYLKLGRAIKLNHDVRSGKEGYVPIRYLEDVTVKDKNKGKRVRMERGTSDYNEEEPFLNA